MPGGLTPTNAFDGNLLAAGTSTTSDIIDAIQRQAAQLDSFNRQLSFSASGELDIPWDGSNVFVQQQSFTHGLNYSPIFLVFCKLASETRWRMCDDLRIGGGGLITLSLTAQSNSQSLDVLLQSFAAGSADVAQFKWFILREPAQ